MGRFGAEFWFAPCMLPKTISVSSPHLRRGRLGYGNHLGSDGGVGIGGVDIHLDDQIPGARLDVQRWCSRQPAGRRTDFEERFIADAGYGLLLAPACHRHRLRVLLAVDQHQTEERSFFVDRVSARIDARTGRLVLARRTTACALPRGIARARPFVAWKCRDRAQLFRRQDIAGGVARFRSAPGIAPLRRDFLHSGCRDRQGNAYGDERRCTRHATRTMSTRQHWILQEGSLPSPRQRTKFPFASAILRATCAQYLDRKSTRLNSSHVEISYAVFCLKK